MPGSTGARHRATSSSSTKDDFIDQVKDIITVGEFYEMAAGGEIIFT